jgi:hypothetical protein
LYFASGLSLSQNLLSFSRNRPSLPFGATHSSSKHERIPTGYMQYALI